MVQLEDFQIYLLSLMSPSVRADEALTRLGMSEREIERAARSVINSGIMNIPHSFALEREVLGIPDLVVSPSGLTVESSSDVSSADGSAYWFARYSLPVIDGYDYEVQVHETGMVTRGRLVRALPEAPMLQGFSSLHSWSHVASEVVPLLGNVELLERLGACEVCEGDLMAGMGPPQRVGLRFVLELLQEAWIVHYDDNDAV